MKRIYILWGAFACASSCHAAQDTSPGAASKLHVDIHSEIFEMDDATAFLTKSRWRPGMPQS